MSPMSFMKTAYCPDCGPAGVPHWVERFGARFDPILNTSTKPMQWFWFKIRPGVYALKAERALPLLYRTLAALRIGVILDAADGENNWRARVLWEEAARRGIAMHEFRPFGLAREIFWAEYDGEVRSFDGLPRPRYASEKSLTWMDDKGIILKKFGAAGIPVPRGGICKTFAEAEKTFEEIGGTVIVKPNLGSRSRHTYVNIQDINTLRHAFLKAKELTPYPVVEEELRGYVFRITLVGGKIAGIMRREAPHVVGDGTHTVRELVAWENEKPVRHGPIFHELHLDADAEAALAKQNLSFGAIPTTGQIAILNEKVSRAYGASTTEFADAEVHRDNRELFLKIGRVLEDPLVGVDFMIEDITKSWHDDGANLKCGVIECNSLPFIDLHHYPLSGKPKNVAGLVWDLIF
jgi:D-alanine-D-alanine ligase-like ATP-grasp enzyme